MKKVKLLLVLISSCLLLKLSGQNPVVDSLENLLQKHTKVDTLRVKLLNKVAATYINLYNENAIVYAAEAFGLSDSLGFNSGKASSLHIMGNYYKATGDFANAITKYQESVEINEQTGNKNELINAYKNMGYCYCMIGKTSEGIVYFKKVLLLNEEEGNKPGIAKAFNNLGNVYQMTGDIELAIEYFNKAIQIWEEIGNKMEIADLYNNLGYLYMNQDQNYNALEAYFTALAVYEEFENESRIALVQNGIGAVYHGLNELIKAKEYFLLSLKTSEALNDKHAIAHCLSNLANIANEESDSENALIYYKKAYKLLSELGYKNEMASVLNNQNKAYKMLGDFKNAIEASDKALSLFKEIENREGEGSTYVGLALTYFKMDKLEEAKYYAIQGLAISDEYGQLTLQKAAHETLYEIYELQKDYKKSLLHHKQFMSINDSLYNEDNVRKITGLEYKYEFEKEKQTIELEQQKKDAINAEKARRQKVVRNSFIGGFSLILLLAIVVFRSLIQKRKANSKLITQNTIISEQKEEKEVLLKEIHHRVKNNLQIISSLLNLQTKNIKDKSTLSAMADGQNRVMAMALIHQKLYQNSDISNIVFKDYTSQLLNQIAGLYPELKDVKREIVSDDIELDIDTAIPVGLILSELITNAYKYAFVNGKGSIVITLKQTENNYILEVQDNGPGLPKDFDLSTASSIGLRLVRRLSRQLYGTSTYKYKNGSRFIITFKDTLSRKETA